MEFLQLPGERRRIKIGRCVPARREAELLRQPVQSPGGGVIGVSAAVPVMA